MNNTGMNVPNISIAPIWTHIVSFQTSHMICQDDPGTNLSVKIKIPDPFHEEHWHECPNRSHHQDPYGLHQSSLQIWQNLSLHKAKCHDDVSRPQDKIQTMNDLNILKQLFVHIHENILTVGFAQGSFLHIICEVWWRLCGSRWGLWRCLGHSCQCCS